MEKILVKSRSVWLNSYQQQIKKYGSMSEFMAKKLVYKRPLIEIIKKYAPHKTILEAGSGSGVMAIALSQQGYKVIGIDEDEEMIHLAKELNYLVQGKAEFRCCSILEFQSNERFDVVFSHGVFEHYEDPKIIELVQAELELGHYLIISVPSESFKLGFPSQFVQPLGDERFMSRSDWRCLLGETPANCIEEFKVPCGPGFEFIGFVLQKQKL